MSRTYRFDPYPGNDKARDGKVWGVQSEPWWWRNAMLTRPKRREHARLCRKIMQGADADGLVWPLGNARPHLWYW
jgi:hypothetical protein